MSEDAGGEFGAGSASRQIAISDGESRGFDPLQSGEHTVVVVRRGARFVPFETNARMKARDWNFALITFCPQTVDILSAMGTELGSTQKRGPACPVPAWGSRLKRFCATSKMDGSGFGPANCRCRVGPVHNCDTDRGICLSFPRAARTWNEEMSVCGTRWGTLTFWLKLACTINDICAH